jgi:hypothetical protein
LRLPLSKAPQNVGVFLASPEDGIIQFLKIALSLFRFKDDGQEPESGDSESKM